MTTKTSDANSFSPLLVNANVACGLLGIKRRKLWSLTASGEIPVCRIGRRTLYSVEALERWVNAQTKGGAR